MKVKGEIDQKIISERAKRASSVMLVFNRDLRYVRIFYKCTIVGHMCHIHVEYIRTYVHDPTL